MTILDHRILIPRPPEAIWTYVSDLSNNPEWQPDSRNIAFLSSRHTGVGVRWRLTTVSGREWIAETTAWYDGLGYEYTFVDGAPFRTSKGRVRLQEIAEGTVVQWTFTYETGGLLASVRNAISLRRQLENGMIAGLRTLWKQMQDSKDGEPARTAKSLMADAVDYEARSRYQPRHPSVAREKAKLQAGDTLPTTVILEPPLSDDDTRPRKPVEAAEVQAVQPQTAEPGLPTDLSVANAEPSPEKVVHSADTTGVLPEDAVRPAELLEIALEAETADPAREVLEVSAARVDAPEGETAEDIESVSMRTTVGSQPAVPVQEDPAKMDTREMSVFDVFGVTRPSQTQEMKTVTLPTETAGVSTGTRIRIGLRFILRRRLIRLRRPGGA